MKIADQILADNSSGSASQTTVPATTVPQTTVEAHTTVAPADDDIDDARLLAALKKRGSNAESLDTIIKPAELTPEQKTAKEKEAKQKAFSFGIGKNLFSQEEYDKYVIDSARPKDEVVFDVFKQDFIDTIKGTADEEAYSEDDIKDMFEAKHGLTEDDKSARKKLGLKLIEKAAAEIINSKYGKILTADAELAAHEAEVTKALEYKGVVDKAFTQMPQTLQYEVDGVNVVFTPTAEILDSVKELYANEAAYKVFGKDATPESIVEAVKHNIAMKDLPRLLKEAAVTYHAQKVQGVRLGRIGAPPEREVGGTAGNSGKRVSDQMIDANKKK